MDFSEFFFDFILRPLFLKERKDFRVDGDAQVVVTACDVDSVKEVSGQSLSNTLPGFESSIFFFRIFCCFCGKFIGWLLVGCWRVKFFIAIQVWECLVFATDVIFEVWRSWCDSAVAHCR